jgi:hypothetical protein
LAGDIAGGNLTELGFKFLLGFLELAELGGECGGSLSFLAQRLLNCRQLMAGILKRLVGHVLDVSEVFELVLKVGAGFLGMGGFVQFLIGQGLRGFEELSRIGEARTRFIAGVFQLHDAHLRQNQLLAHTEENLGRIRVGGLHDWRTIKSRQRGM